MRGNRTTATPASSRTKRITWLISFVIPMALLALMLTLKPAAAAVLKLGPSGQPPASPAVLEVAESGEEEGEEAGEELEECAEAQPEGVEAEEEAEAEEVEEGEPEAGQEEAEACERSTKHRGAPPARCLLRTASARLFIYPSRDRVRVVIRYTMFAPATVAVDYSLIGGKGPRRLGAATRRFATSGLFDVTERLSRRELAKVTAANSFGVTMDIAAAPRSCSRFYTRHLTVRRTAHNRTVWYQPGSASGAPRK